MLAPGDLLVDVGPTEVALNMYVAAVYVVVAIDRGDTPYAPGHVRIADGQSWRRASVTLLGPGPKLIHRDFTWVSRFLKRV